MNLSRRDFALAGLALSLSACRSKAAVDGAAFLKKNATAPGIHVTPSGLQYRVMRSGPPGGKSPNSADEVKVNYEGKLVTGEIFDSSFERGEPASFALNQVIPGWTEVLQLMRPGDEWQVFVPPSLGYGSQSAGSIPPDSVLEFKIELILVPDGSLSGIG